jgi:hypothetical protein
MGVRWWIRAPKLEIPTSSEEKSRSAFGKSDSKSLVPGSIDLSQARCFFCTNSRQWQHSKGFFSHITCPPEAVLRHHCVELVAKYAEAIRPTEASLERLSDHLPITISFESELPGSGIELLACPVHTLISFNSGQ